MIAAYREPDRGKGRQLMRALIASVKSGVPKTLTEVTTLGRTLKKRAPDVLAYFDQPGTSIGPTEEPHCPSSAPDHGRPDAVTVYSPGVMGADFCRPPVVGCWHERRGGDVRGNRLAGPVRRGDRGAPGAVGPPGGGAGRVRGG